MVMHFIENVHFKVKAESNKEKPSKKTEEKKQDEAPKKQGR